MALSFYRGVSFGQVLLMHEKALEEMHFVVEKRDSLPDNLKKSNYFEFLLREMKQTSFENMRKQGEKETAQELLSTKQQQSEKVIPQGTSEKLNSSHAESVQSSEDQRSRGFSVRSHHSSRRNSPSKHSELPVAKVDPTPGNEE